MKRYIVLLNTRFLGGSGHDRPMYYCVSARTQQAAASKVVKMAKKVLCRTDVTVLTAEELTEENERVLREAAAEMASHMDELKHLIETAQKELAAEKKMLDNLQNITRTIDRYDNYGNKSSYEVYRETGIWA